MPRLWGESVNILAICQNNNERLGKLRDLLEWLLALSPPQSER